jgi:hypothetical protein
MDIVYPILKQVNSSIIYISRWVHKNYIRKPDIEKGIIEDIESYVNIEYPEIVIHKHRKHTCL